MGPLLLAATVAALLVVWFGMRYIAALAQRPVATGHSALPRFSSPTVAPSGEAFERLVDTVHRQFVDRVRSRPQGVLEPEAERRDFRRVIEHIVDTVCPLLNAIERDLLVETVLGRVPRFAPPTEPPTT